MEETMRINGNLRKCLLCTAGLAGVFMLNVSVGRADDAGQKLYSSKCAACHGPDGKGETTVGKANKLRDLASADVQKQSDEELTTIITGGKAKMPAYGKSLKPDQIKNLVDYIRTLKK
jgi:mono/diheme cytochrome c family protein